MHLGIAIETDSCIHVVDLSTSFFVFPDSDIEEHLIFFEFFCLLPSLAPWGTIPGLRYCKACGKLFGVEEEGRSGGPTSTKSPWYFHGIPMIFRLNPMISGYHSKIAQKDKDDYDDWDLTHTHTAGGPFLTPRLRSKYLRKSTTIATTTTTTTTTTTMRTTTTKPATEGWNFFFQNASECLKDLKVYYFLLLSTDPSLFFIPDLAGNAITANQTASSAFNISSNGSATIPDTRKASANLSKSVSICVNRKNEFSLSMFEYQINELWGCGACVKCFVHISACSKIVSTYELPTKL